MLCGVVVCAAPFQSPARSTSRQWVKDGFNATFAFSVSDSQADGGGGIAFVVSCLGLGGAANVQPVGTPGGGLGYSGLSKTIAVEFDMYLDSEQKDPNNNHVSVHSLEMAPNSAVELLSPLGGLLKGAKPLINTNPLGNAAQLLRSGTHNVTIRYDPLSTILDPYVEVYIDQITSPIMTVSVDLSTIGLLGGDVPGFDGFAFIGVTSSTGNAYQIHNLHYLTFSGTPTAMNLTPLRGPVAGGNVVLVAGANFNNGTHLMCKFGSKETNATFLDANTLSCVAPAHGSDATLAFAISTHPGIWLESSLTYTYGEPITTGGASSFRSHQCAHLVLAMMAVSVAMALVCL
mmetsp:Transcript_45087/g.106317  ORF Transcript_45087/g.106317 Transcript_45087/m.106317 type:complete len:346 (-) Transcript_45087:22-1059(-)